MGDPERPEHPPSVGFDVQIGVDDREIRALFQKQQMSEAVVDLVVADGGHVRPHQIHDADGGGILVLRINDAAAEHISRHGVDHVLFLSPHFIDIARQQRHAAHQPFVDLFGQKIAMHIVRVQDRQPFQILHTPLLSSAADRFSARLLPSFNTGPSGLTAV